MPRREPQPTLFGVPVPVLLKDPRFLGLMRAIIRERGGDPNLWTALNPVDIERLRERQAAARSKQAGA